MPTPPPRPRPIYHGTRISGHPKGEEGVWRLVDMLEDQLERARRVARQLGRKNRHVPNELRAALGMPPRISGGYSRAQWEWAADHYRALVGAEGPQEFITPQILEWQDRWEEARESGEPCASFEEAEPDTPRSSRQTCPKPPDAALDIIADWMGVSRRTAYNRLKESLRQYGREQLLPKHP